MAELELGNAELIHKELYKANPDAGKSIPDWHNR